MRAAPMAPAKRPTPKQSAFKQTGDGGYMSHGFVHSANSTDDGKSMHVEVRHGKKKSGHDGLFDSYDRSSRFHLPAEAAKHFPVGQPVEMHLKKRRTDAGVPRK